MSVDPLGVVSRCDRHGACTSFEIRKGAPCNASLDELQDLLNQRVTT